MQKLYIMYTKIIQNTKSVFILHTNSGRFNDPQDTIMVIAEQEFFANLLIGKLQIWKLLYQIPTKIFFK